MELCRFCFRDLLRLLLSLFFLFCFFSERRLRDYSIVHSFRENNLAWENASSSAWDTDIFTDFCLLLVNCVIYNFYRDFVVINQVWSFNSFLPEAFAKCILRSNLSRLVAKKKEVVNWIISLDVCCILCKLLCKFFRKTKIRTWKLAKNINAFWKLLPVKNDKKNISINELVYIMTLSIVKFIHLI